MRDRLLSHFLLTLWFFAFALPAGSPAQEEAPNKEFTLRFSWPAGTTASVRSEAVKEKRRGEQRQRLESSGQFTMSVAALGDGKLAVEFEPQGPPPTVTIDGKAATGPQAVLASLQSMLPTIVISDAGPFLGIQGAERIRAALKNLFQEATGGRPLPGQAEQMLDQMTSTQVLTQAAENEWNAIVGFWIGQQLEAGAVYDREATAPLPLPGAPSVALRTETSVGEPFPCIAGNPKPICVRLRTVSRPDREEVKAVLEAFVEKAAEAFGTQFSVVYKDLDVITKTDLVTEIETLKPHEYLMEKEVHAVLMGPNGEEIEGSQLDRRHSVYTY